MNLPETKKIILSVHESILTIKINNPPNNQLNSEFFEDLSKCLDLMTSSYVRAIIFTTEGRNFSKGADLNEIVSSPFLFNRKTIQFANQLLNSISELKKPVIAAIRGACFGGGLELALACHLRVCSEKALLGLPELSIGLLPGLGGIQRLTRIVGEAKTLEMILLGDLIPSQKALEIHLINRVFPRKTFMEDVLLWVKTILSVPQKAIEETLTLVAMSRSDSEPHLIDKAAESFLQLFNKKLGLSPLTNPKP